MRRRRLTDSLTFRTTTLYLERRFKNCHQRPHRWLAVFLLSYQNSADLALFLSGTGKFCFNLFHLSKTKKTNLLTANILYAKITLASKLKTSIG